MSSFASDLLELDTAVTATPTPTPTTTTTSAEDLATQIAQLKLQNEKLKNKKKSKSKKTPNDDAGNASDSSSSSSSSSSDSSSSSSSSDDSSGSDSDGNDDDQKGEKTKKTKKTKKMPKSTPAFATNDGDDDFFDQLSGDAPKGGDEVIVEGHEYLVNLPRHSSGPGIVWETDWGGMKAAVKSFKRTDDGQHGPAANSGLIDLGHVLVCVNGKRVVGKPFEEQVKYVERASKKNKGKGEYVLTMCDPERSGGGTSGGGSGSGSGSGRGSSGSGSGGRGSSTSKSSRKASSASNDGGALNLALKEVHRNKLKYYQAVPSQEMTQCFIERYRGDHVTSFHMHRQSDSAFILAASMPCAMKGDVVFHTLQDMTWEATMKDIPTGACDLFVCFFDVVSWR